MRFWFVFVMYLLTNTLSMYSFIISSYRVTLSVSRSLRTLRAPPASRSRLKATDEPAVLPVVEVINKTRRKIDTEKVAEQVKTILELLGRSDFGVDVEFCSDDRIRRLNADWRGKGKPTDVLSFTNFEFDEPEVFSKASQQVFHFNRQLGEIVIAPQYVLKQCREDKKDYEIGMQTAEGRAELQAEWASDAGCSRAMATLFTLKERTPLLVVHSLLHLLGYDHETEEDWRAMTAREDEVIKLYYQHIQQQQVEKQEVGNLGKDGESSIV